MKRLGLMKELEQARCVLVRDGGRYDICQNPKTGRSEPVARRREINGNFARRSIRRLAGAREKQSGETIGSCERRLSPDYINASSPPSQAQPFGSVVAFGKRIQSETSYGKFATTWPDVYDQRRLY